MTRRNFSNQTKRDAWDRCQDAYGIARCEHCTAQLSVGNVHYDERIDGEFDHAQCDAMLGEPTLENCQVLCRNCHGRKTRRDRKTIAKSNHTRDLARGIRSQSFNPIPGSRNSIWRKRMNGTVERRDASIADQCDNPMEP